MITLTLRGNQIGEALQFDANGGTTTVEIGRVWFTAADTVTLTLAASALDPVTGAVVGGAGTILGMTVRAADGRVTTFAQATNPLDVDPDTSKQGANFFYISESPAPGTGGAFAGLQLEKIVISATPLTANSFGTYANGGGFTGVPTGQPPGGPNLTGTPGDDVLTGTNGADAMRGLDGNDRITARGGNDTVDGDNGNDVVDGGGGADRMWGGEGNDRMLGGNGADGLWGGDGDDLLDGGAGRDTLAGGQGGDSFVFGDRDRVADFNAGQGDEVVFAASLGLSLADITVTQTANATLIAWAGQTMRLEGVTEPFDLGNHIKFDYVPSLDFL